MWLTILKNKGVQNIAIAVVILVGLMSLYFSVSNSISNLVTQKVNINEKENQIEVLKSNQKAEIEKQKEEIKVQEFNLKVEAKKETLQGAVDTYKKKETHEIIKPDDTPVYFPLD